MRPMFAALPKNSEGLLGHSAVRYALHRYFAKRHGWSVKGLDPAGGSWNASSASTILQDRAPAYVQEIFEQRLSGRGLGLHDLAALAATLEHLVHDDAVSRLESAYRALGLKLTAGNREDEVVQAVDTFMMMFVLGQDIKNLSSTEIQAERASILQTYPTWNDTRDFVRDVYRNVTSSVERKGSVLARQQLVEFEQARQVVETLQDRYGPWQDRECQGMKNGLLKMEENQNGRVSLADFYSHTIEGGWQFTESIDYLRELGALDESNPKKPRVIVANYMSGASNCLATTGFYSVCCINECEAILGRVEQGLGAPTASPQEVAAVVAAVPSATVKAPRDLPSSLVQRLGEIAEANGGQVPLHGRLFSQWLHHAFPRECPYPHAAGATNPMSPAEWMAETGKSAVATDEALQQHASAAETADGAEAEVQGVPWTGVEELVLDGRSSQARAPRMWRTWVKWALLLAAVAAMFLSVCKEALALAGSKSQQELLLPMSAKSHSA